MDCFSRCVADDDDASDDVVAAADVFTLVLASSPVTRMDSTDLNNDAEAQRVRIGMILNAHISYLNEGTFTWRR